MRADVHRAAIVVIAVAALRAGAQLPAQSPAGGARKTAALAGVVVDP